MIKWIKCSERLPLELEDVLIYVLSEQEIYIGYCIKGKWRSVYDSRLMSSSVSHWQPLPAPPEG